MRPLRLFFACALAACTSSSTSSPDGGTKPDAAAAVTPDGAPTANSVTGAIGGSAYDAIDAVSVAAHANGFEFDMTSTDIKISDFAGACAKETANVGSAYGRLLFVGLAVIGSDGHSAPATATGDYTIVTAAPAASTNAAEVFYEADGADCLKSVQHQATSGKVTVTKVGDPIEGTFDLTFSDTGEHITGTFSAPNCAGLNPNRTPTGGC
jgi:hypothetical protein